MPERPSLLHELKRRRVLRVAAVYAVAAWVVLQVATTVAPLLDLPGWVPRLVLLLLALGFPVAVGLAWAFAWTPEGLRRERDLLADVPGPAAAGRPRDARGAAGWLGAGVLLALAAFGAYARYGAGAEAASDRSVAVLPFVDMSPAHDQGYFTDGITEEILDALANVPGLRVAARTSSFAFKGKAEDVGGIGKALRVGHVLEGSIQRAGGRVRITAQLIDAATGYHLWSEKYDRPAGDVFAVEDEISKAIASQLQARLRAGAPRTRAASTTSVDAHDLYLLGLDRWNHRNTASLVTAEEFFQRALALDSTYAQAWAGLALTDALLPEYDDRFTPDSFWTSGVAAARRALALDSGSAEAHAALSQIFQYRDELARAEAEARAAIRLNPSYATAYQWLSEVLVLEGRLPEAEEAARRAVALDPLSGVVVKNLAASEGGLGRYDDALAHMTRAVQLDSGFDFARLRLAETALGAGRVDVARGALAELFSRHGMDAALADSLVAGYRAPSARPSTERVLARADVRARMGSCGDCLVALYEIVGDRDSALAVANRVAGDPVSRTGFRTYTYVLGARMRGIRDDPRLPPGFRTPTPPLASAR